jgi:hypothetical protein
MEELFNTKRQQQQSCMYGQKTGALMLQRCICSRNAKCNMCMCATSDRGLRTSANSLLRAYSQRAYVLNFRHLPTYCTLCSKLLQTGGPQGTQQENAAVRELIVGVYQPVPQTPSHQTILLSEFCMRWY